jgi:hypothetical protein
MINLGVQKLKFSTPYKNTLSAGNRVSSQQHFSDGRDAHSKHKFGLRLIKATSDETK